MSAKQWLISDLHLGHNNMYSFVGFDGVTRVRPQFDSAKEADEFMLDAWNAIVSPQDHVQCLGDVAIPKGALQLVKKLNGHKRLILGNHDLHPIKDYLDAGFKKIYGLKQMSGLWLSHAPLHWGEEHAASRQNKFFGNAHGHIHEMRSPTQWHFNCCVEWTGYRPVDLEFVIETMRKRKANGYKP
jgi:calcineurin-like phosphoesterase family protein